MQPTITDTMAPETLRSIIAEQRAALEDAQQAFDALRSALDVPEEPRLTLRKRMIEAAGRHRFFEERLADMEEADSIVVRGMQAEILLLRAELAFERRSRGLGHRLMRAIFPPQPRSPR